LINDDRAFQNISRPAHSPLQDIAQAEHSGFTAEKRLGILQLHIYD